MTSFFRFVDKPAIYFFVNSHWDMRDPYI